MDQILYISESILIIGGAFSMILMVFILLGILMLIMRTHSLVTNIKEKIDMVQTILLMPLEFIASLIQGLLTNKDKDRQSGVVAKNKKTTKKSSQDRSDLRDGVRSSLEQDEE